MTLQESVIFRVPLLNSLHFCSPFITYNWPDQNEVFAHKICQLGEEEKRTIISGFLLSYKVVTQIKEKKCIQ